MHQRGVLTLAFGASKFIEMAKSLGRSLQLHDPLLPRAVVTDSSDPGLKNLYTEIIPYHPEYGTNVRQKVMLDRYSPYQETLFVDSDCLAVRGLDSFWQAFQSSEFGACGGRTLRSGEVDIYLDVEFFLRHFNLESLAKFNGGIYYFKKSPSALAVFETARDIMFRFENNGFKSFRGDGPCDEAIYSVAMAIHKIGLTDMGIGGMWTPYNAVGPIVVDIVNGVCEFSKQGRALKPDIIHFASITEEVKYLRECRKLERFCNGKSGMPIGDELQVRFNVAGLWLTRKSKGLRRRIKARLNRLTKSKADAIEETGVDI